MILENAIEQSQEAGNELLDLNDTIWEDEMDEIVAEMKERNILEFTISNTSTGLLETLNAFEVRGAKIICMAKVNSPYKNFSTGERKKLNAIKLSF